MTVAIIEKSKKRRRGGPKHPLRGWDHRQMRVLDVFLRPRNVKMTLVPAVMLVKHQKIIESDTYAIPGGKFRTAAEIREWVKSVDGLIIERVAPVAYSPPPPPPPPPEAEAPADPGAVLG